jgi:hypothetical protein
MYQANTNVIVDLTRALSDEHGDSVVSKVSSLRGVSAVRVSPRTSRLLLVDYDPTVTDSQRILRACAGQGFDARLVGL